MAVPRGSFSLQNDSTRSGGWSNGACEAQPASKHAATAQVRFITRLLPRTRPTRLQRPGEYFRDLRLMSQGCSFLRGIAEFTLRLATYRSAPMTHVSPPTRGRFIGGTAPAAGGAFGFPGIITAQSKQIVIGLDIPLSGPYADQGKDQQRAYDLAIDQVNKSGGIMGMQVKASVGDDQTTAGVATDNAQRMIDRDGAVMITGGSSTGTAVAVSALCQRKATLFMATLTHGDETTNQNCHKHTFRRYNDAYMSAQALARTLISRYGTGTWFHITADYSWGWSVHDNLAAVVHPKGAQEIAYVKLKLGTTDFSSALSQAQAAKPDVLVLTEFGADMVNCLNQAATFGLTKTCKILVPLVDEYMAKGTKDNFTNVVSTAPFYWQYHAKHYTFAKKFVEAFYDR